MKIISYNIQFGRGLDGVVDLVRSCEAVRGADIICLQEVDQHWRRSGDTDQPAEIAGLLPTYHWVYGSSFDVDASARSAHGAVIHRRRRHGNLVLSRWPILSSRCFNLPKQDYTDKFNMQMGFIECVVATEPEPLRVYNYHAGYLGSAERLEQVRTFASVFTRSPAEGGAWSGKRDIDGDDWSNRHDFPPMPASAIVCGDFNAAPDTEEYRLLLDSTGLVDCWAQVDSADLAASTLRKETSDDIRITGKVDHILVTTNLVPAVREAAIDRDADGSDHRPVSVRLELS